MGKSLGPGEGYKEGPRESPAQKCGPCLWGMSRVEDEERGEEYFDRRKKEKSSACIYEE